MNEVKEFILIIAIILLVPGSIIAFVGGAIDSTSPFSKGCTYSNIASYHPFYIAGCELFKKRFSNENKP